MNPQVVHWRLLTSLVGFVLRPFTTVPAELSLPFETVAKGRTQRARGNGEQVLAAMAYPLSALDLPPLATATPMCVFCGLWNFTANARLRSSLT